MAATIERYCAPGVFDAPTYSQGIKVTGAQTILFLAGQVAYDDKGLPASTWALIERKTARAWATMSPRCPR